MKILDVYALNTPNELEKVIAVNSQEDILGYFIANQVIVLQPSYMCDESYNDDYVARTNIPILNIPAKGGTIVCNTGDIGFLHITNDLYSNWNLPAQKYVANYLRKIYAINANVHNNDVLINDKKFVGTASGFVGNKHIAAMFISMNDSTTWLINKICKKKSNYSGFTGLNAYNVCARSLINAVMNFSKNWEARGL